MKRQTDPDVLLLQAAADPTRLAILRQLAAVNGPICACDFTDCCDLSQPTVSHHLRLLREAGWDIHYFNVSNGNMGSTVLSAAETERTRTKEAQRASKLLGAKWYAPICDDLQIFYTDENIRRVCAVVRAAQPSVVLTHALQDYMEDHMITARLAVTGTFTRGIPNYRSKPPRKGSLAPVTVYHAMPHGQDIMADELFLAPLKHRSLNQIAAQRIGSVKHNKF